MTDACSLRSAGPGANGQRVPAAPWPPSSPASTLLSNGVGGHLPRNALCPQILLLKPCCGSATLSLSPELASHEMPDLAAPDLGLPAAGPPGTHVCCSLTPVHGTFVAAAHTDWEIGTNRGYCLGFPGPSQAPGGGGGDPSSASVSCGLCRQMQVRKSLPGEPWPVGWPGACRAPVLPRAVPASWCLEAAEAGTQPESHGCPSRCSLFSRIYVTSTFSVFL